MEVFNFSAGPSMLFKEVLKKVQDELLDYNGTGMSVMEMSHRSKPYEQINKEAEELLRELMGITNDYEVIFVQGGASTQFEAVPLNISVNKKADYIISGNFSKRAFEEAQKYGDMAIAASSEESNFSHIPLVSPSSFRQDADYVHICHNNTIFGTRFNSIPCTGSIPLVADISSSILSQELDVTKFDVLYAGAQKNLAPAGVTVVIVKKSMLGKSHPLCPTMLKWETQIKEHSLFNTPPAFSTYVAMLVMRHIKEMGGVKVIQKLNEEKASLLYDFIDNSSFYSNNINKADRSIMNVPFITKTKELDELFVSQAAKCGLVTLKGHRLVGGMRASIYNAMPLEGIKALIDFMKKFEKENA